MALFDTENSLENFRQQLIKYFLLKNDQEIVSLLRGAILKCL